MLLDIGTLDGTRIVSRTSVQYTTGDRVRTDGEGSRQHALAAEHLAGIGVGLGVSVRTYAGSPAAGMPGGFLWSSAQGTMFSVDPRAELAVVFPASTPGPVRRHGRQLVKHLAMQAIAD